MSLCWNNEKRFIITKWIISLIVRIYLQTCTQLNKVFSPTHIKNKIILVHSDFEMIAILKLFIQKFDLKPQP